MYKYQNSEVIVILEHPHGRLEVPLEDWMAEGPGERELLKPIATKSKKTGKSLPLHIVPLRYRNNHLSRTLIATGFLSNPWREKPSNS